MENHQNLKLSDQAHEQQAPVPMLIHPRRKELKPLAFKQAIRNAMKQQQRPKNRPIQLAAQPQVFPKREMSYLKTAQAALLQDRFWANAIDLILAVMVVAITGLVLAKRGVDSTNEVFLTYIIFGVVFLTSYGPIATCLGVTFGQFVMEIRVRNRNGKPLTLSQSYVRSFSKYLLLPFAPLTIFLLGRKRALHDYLVGSYVVIKSK
jgi:uncharacterized RDD family membrane protein YckC